MNDYHWIMAFTASGVVFTFVLMCVAQFYNLD